MSASSTELVQKWNVVSQHLRQLLRLPTISGSVALALSAFYAALGLTTLLLHAARFLVLAGRYVRQQLHDVLAVRRHRGKVNT